VSERIAPLTLAESSTCQTLSGDSALQQKADEYGISLGKATLIQSLVDSSNHLTFESLVGLSINELNLLANSTAVQTPDSAGGQNSTTASNPALNSVGTASQSAYIGVEAAKEAALTHAGDQWGRGVPGG
ncbi:hypothetical protein NE659_25540, partial [Flavonifractor plautii]|nr:hypothetical protein [Flavonifractor plautii]